MPQAPRMSDPVQKHICEYFDGDSEGSVYVYRSGSALARMYTERFGITDYESGPSRWMLCSDTINYMYEQGRINDFFTTMLSLRNISKELREINQSVAAGKRREAIDEINRILLADDLELLDFGNQLILHHMDDDSDLIGSGGFANVYRIPGTDMVVKKLKDQFKDNAGIVSRFKHEYYLIHEKLQGIDGIIQGFEYNEEDISYTMEFCNCDLKQYIADAHFSEDERIDLVLEILNIMNRVHECKVLHRDLSPKNIFIRNGHPVIADFGLGKAIDDNGRTYVTIDTSMNGTLEYCDPRQFQGLGFADEQSDIYSLGRIINFVMTGDSDNFKHALSLVSTIATETSLDARYHSVQEMIVMISRSAKVRKDVEYMNRCEQLLKTGYYDNSMDDYLLSFEDGDLLGKLNDPLFRKVYMNIVTNISYGSVLIERFTGLHNIFCSPIGYTFSSFDDVAYLCVNVLRDHKEVSPALKTVLGQCIYDIAEGVNRWNAQSYFDDNARLLEPEYVLDSLAESTKRKK